VVDELPACCVVVLNIRFVCPGETERSQ
jgi:hypothetical protein